MKLSAPEDNTRIVIQGAREHNLKNLSVTIPRDKFTVVTGPSGSGKSTLAFDLVFAEGQRRYLESLNAYARSMVQPAPAPEVDSIRGIPPTVAIEQRTSRGGLRSTVGTTTELLHFLRLLFVKLGTQYCPDCGIPASPQSHDDIIKAIRRDFGSDQIAVLAPIVRRQKGIFRAEMEAAAVAGHRIMRIDGAYIDISLKIPSLARYSEHELELAVGICGADEQALEKIVAAALLHGHGRLLVTRSLPDEPTTGLLEQDVFYSTLAACPSCLKSFLQLERRRVSEVLRLRSHHFGAQEGAEKEGGLQHRPQRHGGGGALPRLSGDSSESRCKGGALARQKHFGLRCNDDRQRGGVLPKPQARGTRGGHCSRRGRRDPVSPLLPSGSGTRIPHARPQRADAFRR